MNDQPKIAAAHPAPVPFHEPGELVIRNVNWAGMRALYRKEVRRFMKVQLQTIWAPAVTTLMFLVIFTIALGGANRQVLGVPFADFIAPGLMMMGMMNNAFANSSFSLLAGKMQGTLIDYLMPPLSVGELLLALVGAAVTRAVAVVRLVPGAKPMPPVARRIMSPAPSPSASAVSDRPLRPVIVPPVATMVIESVALWLMAVPVLPSATEAPCTA